MTGEHTSVIYGTHYPNRLFVGCLPPEAGAEDLGCFFSTFGHVVEAKVVLDNHGRSKRFGFVTFSNEKDVESTLCCGKEIFFKGKKINVGPAVKKNLDTEAATAKVLPKQPAKPPPPVTMSLPTAPQHMPTTVIRRSPTESLHLPYDSPPQQDDDTFRSIWGITTKTNSIWAPIHDEKPRAISQTQEKSFSNRLLPTQEKSFSLFNNWMQENNNQVPENHMQVNQQAGCATQTTQHQLGSGTTSLRAPPGLNRAHPHHHHTGVHHNNQFQGLMFGQ